MLAGKAPQDAPVTVKGWVRTRRDSKAGISFVYLSDGSSFHPVQVVAPNTLPNYADEVLKLTTGCVHRFFDENNFFWVNTPIITGSDAEGAGELFRVSTLDLANLPPRRMARLISCKIFLVVKHS
jgi:aspartyl/asparaginyl-tRNA synthetase